MQLSFKIISAPGPEDVIIRDFIAENDNDFYPPIAARRDLKDFVQSVYDHNGKYIICYSGDHVVGLTSIYLNHPSFITYYHYVAVNKDYRHKGVASTLYTQMHEICRELGVQRAIVKTWSTNSMSQGMFHKHGFFHLDTIEDDRSPGVHTYFFAKSFMDGVFRRPFTRLAILGGNDSYALTQVARTVSSIPRSNGNGRYPLPYTAVSAPFGNIDTADKVAVKEQLRHVIACLDKNEVSHVLLIDGYNYPGLDLDGIETGIEFIDLAAITRKMVNARKKKTLLIAADIGKSLAYFDVANVQIPGSTDAKKIAGIINDIRSGLITPGYHKHEIATIALLNDCDCILLGSVELHTMFGSDKLYNGVEIFDPWMELAIIIQNDRITTKTPQ